MALTKTTTLKSQFGTDVIFHDAYLRVGKLDGGKNLIVVHLDTYKIEGDLRPVKTDLISFAPSLEGPNFIAQAYAHIKTLEEYSDAKDC